jgi:hypothetical protein
VEGYLVAQCKEKWLRAVGCADSVQGDVMAQCRKFHGSVQGNAVTNNRETLWLSAGNVVDQNRHM